MAVDKHSQDAVAKLYAEWVSAGVKLSVAGFAATTKIMEAATQSIVPLRARASAAEAEKLTPAPAAGQPEEKAATVTSLKIVQNAAVPTKTTPSTPQAFAKAAPERIVAAKPATPQAEQTKPATVANDLKLISGIGPKLEQMLVRKGITSFAQLAALSADDVAKLDTGLNLNGRIQRDDWVGQAMKLAEA